MNDAFGCSRATQVLKESPESFNLADPMLNNEQFNLVAFTLDAQTHKTTIKLKIAANRNTYE